MTSGNDILMGSGAAGFSFDFVGAVIGGRVLNEPVPFEEREWNPQTKRSDGAVKRFTSGDPIMGAHVDLQTTLRDPQNPDDDGKRRLYIRGQRMKSAVRDAVLRAGAKGIQPGGVLTVTFTHEEDTGQGNAAKCYVAEYQAPGQQAFMGQQQQAPQQGWNPPATPAQPDPWAGAPAWAQPPAGAVPQQAPQQPPAAPQPVQQPAPAPQVQPAPPAAPAVDLAAAQAALANLSPEQLRALGLGS